MDWSRHQEALSQLFSWMAGGMIGGITLSLVSSSISVSSGVFWIFMGLIAIVGYYFSFIHVNIKIEEDTVQSDLAEIKSELSELRSDVSEPASKLPDETPEMEHDN